jgi:outer membrane protein with beta-barrel domain
MALGVKSQLACCVTAIVTLGPAAPVAAQTPATPRVELSANFGVLGAGRTFTQDASFNVNVETASLTAEHGAKASPLIDVGTGVRIARHVWVQVSFTSASHEADATVSASIPHPLLFNRPRPVQGAVPGLSRTELGVHVDAMWAFATGGAVDLKLMAGPTFFNVKQDLVSQVNYTESYPFDTASFNGAATTERSKSGVGFNAAVDVGRTLTSMIAIGAIIRYSAASLDFADPTTGSATVKAGGFEASGGVRVRF